VRERERVRDKGACAQKEPSPENHLYGTWSLNVAVTPFTHPFPPSSPPEEAAGLGLNSGWRRQGISPPVAAWDG
jgi:hypothetical protein